MSRKLFYFFTNLITSGVAFLTTLALSKNLDTANNISQTGLFQYFILQVGGGMTNIFLGFRDIRKITDHILTKNRINLYLLLSVTCCIYSPLVGSFVIGIFASIVSYALVFCSKGRTAALINLLNSTLLLVAGLLSLSFCKGYTSYILLIFALPAVLLGSRHVVVGAQSCGDTMRDSTNRIMAGTIVAMIILAIVYGLTNIYVLFIFQGSSALSSYVVSDKIIASISIALGSHYMSEGFFNQTKVSISLRGLLETFALTFLLGCIAIFAVKYTINLIDPTRYLSFELLFIFFASAAWVANFFSGKYLRAIQNGSPTRFNFSTFHLVFLLLNFIGLIIVTKVVTMIYGVESIDGIIVNGTLYVGYWSFVLILLKAMYDKTPNAHQ